MVLAIVAVACHAAYLIWQAGGGARTDEDDHVRAGLTRLETRVARPAYALILLTGLVLVVDGGWSVDRAWLLVSLGLFAALVAIGLTGRARWVVVALTVAIAWLMVTKPG